MCAHFWSMYSVSGGSNTRSASSDRPGSLPQTPAVSVTNRSTYYPQHTRIPSQAYTRPAPAGSHRH
ncbi:hypothetical protein L227DRAFT_333080 [Lentinus tigrinus ALCF2SS1-6]|uniref:Uncharacterized protein n=1 Tax=Lentinus tigrinus ALCF2SS1-6 TaxID=1328759 RepID=A0A5C2RTQ5_9APHY|nr:hypothetical protein L227DRAFT_333080 [Lentinus tigrinus ALCF2SS1-6]